MGFRLRVGASCCLFWISSDTSGHTVVVVHFLEVCLHGRDDGRSRGDHYLPVAQRWQLAGAHFFAGVGNCDFTCFHCLRPRFACEGHSNPADISEFDN